MSRSVHSRARSPSLTYQPAMFSFVLHFFSLLFSLSSLSSLFSVMTPPGSFVRMGVRAAGSLMYTYSASKLVVTTCGHSFSGHSFSCPFLMQGVRDAGGSDIQVTKRASSCAAVL